MKIQHEKLLDFSALKSASSALESYSIVEHYLLNCDHIASAKKYHDQNELYAKSLQLRLARFFISNSSEIFSSDKMMLEEILDCNQEVLHHKDRQAFLILFLKRLLERFPVSQELQIILLSKLVEARDEGIN